MNGQVQKHGYNSKVNVAFWENATFVFWLCQNSWFWVWKNFFSITIFHKIHFAYYVSSPFLHQKALKQSICLILAFCSHGNASNTLFECFRCKIKGATENGNFFSWKMVILKFFFQTQNQLFWHSQKTKVAFSQKAMME